MKKALFSILLLVLCGCSPINKWLGLPDDNIAEEMIEDIIKGRTGLDIDLTPETPEVYV